MPDNEYYIESVSGTSSLELQRARIWVNRENFAFGSESETTLEVKLNNAKLFSSPKITADQLIKARFFITNIPYFKNDKIVYNINIEERQFTFKPYQDGTITTIVEIDNIPYSEINQIQDLIKNICWLLSFASGKLCGIGKVEIFENDNLRHLEVYSIDSSQNSDVSI